MAVPTFVFMICSLRTNVVFVALFLTIMLGFCLLAGSFWHLAMLDVGMAHNLQIVGFWHYSPLTFLVADLPRLEKC